MRPFRRHATCGDRNDSLPAGQAAGGGPGEETGEGSRCRGARGEEGLNVREILGSIEAEYRRYKALAEGAFAQLSDAELSEPGPNGGNSIAIIARHMAGNFASRFTDFLTSDGEKPWRRREEEFASTGPGRQQLLEHWESGWRILFDSLSALTDADLEKTVTIRGEKHSVHQALHRSLAHASYHVGQIVYAAKGLRGPAWTYLSIPPSQSDVFTAKVAGEQNRKAQ
jgi:hypothetical protein